MAKKRPVFYPALGEYFTGLREAKKWKQAHAADMAARRGLELSYQTLRGLEEGKTKNADPDALRAVAALYEVPFEEVLAAFITHRFGVSVAASDLSRHGRTGQRTPHVEGVAVDPASARVLEERRKHEQLAEKIKIAASSLLQIAVGLQEEAGATAPGKAGSKSRHRKTG